jgi:hypothetical protein
LIVVIRKYCCIFDKNESQKLMVQVRDTDVIVPSIIHGTA